LGLCDALNWPRCVRRRAIAGRNREYLGLHLIQHNSASRDSASSLLWLLRPTFHLVDLAPKLQEQVPGPMRTMSVGEAKWVVEFNDSGSTELGSPANRSCGAGSDAFPFCADADSCTAAECGVRGTLCSFEPAPITGSLLRNVP
jgi:hypothetical protein